MLTPVGDLTKEQTRTVARQLGLVTADKKESVEICFVPDDNYVACSNNIFLPMRRRWRPARSSPRAAQ